MSEREHAPQKHVALASLPVSTVKALVSNIDDPDLKAQGKTFLAKRERSEAAKRKATKRSQKSARRHNRRR